VEGDSSARMELTELTSTPSPSSFLTASNTEII
jgi:hypothetical protein